MYFQFLIEDKSTEILVNRVMEKVKDLYSGNMVNWDIKSFAGIGNRRRDGNLQNRKTGKLLNDLPMYMRGFSKVLQNMDHAALVVVMDNDKRDTGQFKEELEQIAISNFILCDYVFCVAVKEMEAWLLGDSEAIREAYPNARMQFLQKYEQDGICDTWEILAEIVYPKGLSGLRKKAGGSYAEIGKAKGEWADKIGQCLHLHENVSPSYCYFIGEIEKRIST